MPKIAFLSVLLLFCFACSRDKIEPVVFTCEDQELTYNQEIKEIIDLTCSYGGCHLDVAPGIYTTYEGLLPILNSGQFSQRVLVEQNMPPLHAVSQLTDEQFVMLQCWVEKGYKE